MSEASYGRLYENWLFSMLPLPAKVFAKRFHAMFESGLVDLWKGWSYRVESWNGTVNEAKYAGNEWKGVSLDGNYVTVFYIYGCLLGLGLAFFVHEVRKSVIKATKKLLVDVGWILIYIGLRIYYLTCHRN